jgi:nicotinamidase-related amidase
MGSSDDLQSGAWRFSEVVVPRHTALLIQELQRGVVGPGSGLPALAGAVDEVGLVGHAVRLVGVARAAGVTVIHCTAETLPGDFGANRNSRLFAAARKAGMTNRPGSESVRPIDGLGPEPGDVVLPRFHGLSPLTGSSLDQLLRNSSITTVVIIGVSLNIAIPNLVFDAVNRSYQVVVVSDAVAGTPSEYGRQVVEHSLSLVATVVTTEDLVNIWSADQMVDESSRQR